MKSRIFLIFSFLSGFLMAQTPFPSGIKLPNATEGSTSTTPIRSVTINSFGVVNGWEEISAENTVFDGTVSAMTSTNVQDAIDEVVGMISSGGGGTVTSVGLSVPTGLQVSGSPVTSAGTIGMTYQSGYSIPTTTSQSNWDTAFGWGNHATAGYLTSYTETDPTIFSWAKASTKPTYTWSEITSKPTFHAVATSGDYDDLINKPTIPTTPNLTQVLTEGNLINDYFGTVIEFENPYGPNYSIFNEDGNLMFSDVNGDNGLILNDDGSIRLQSTSELRLNNQTFPSTAGTNGQVLTTDGTNMSWTTPSSGSTYSAGVGINITSALPNDVINLKPATSSEIGGVKVWKGTQNDYDALGTYDNNTLYYIETTPVRDRVIIPLHTKVGTVLPAMSGSTPETFTPIDLLDICPVVDLDYIDWEITWKDGGVMYKASALGDFNLQLSWSGGACFQLTGQTMSTVSYALTGGSRTDAKLILYY